jgi:single stranded DNA-binding protein
MAAVGLSSAKATVGQETGNHEEGERTVMSQNYVQITGYLGADPSIRTMTGGETSFAKFALAQSVSRFDPEQKSYDTIHTNWFQIKATGALAHKVKAVLKKGNRVTVTGRIHTYEYKRVDGSPMSAFEIVATDIMRSESLKRVTDSNNDQVGATHA